MYLKFIKLNPSRVEAVCTARLVEIKSKFLEVSEWCGKGEVDARRLHVPAAPQVHRQLALHHTALVASRDLKQADRRRLRCFITKYFSFSLSPQDYVAVNIEFPMKVNPLQDYAES